MMKARRLKKAVIIGCALVATGLAAQNAQAGSTHWILDPPTVGDWFDLANWDSGVPTSATWAFIDNGGTAMIGSGTARTLETYVGPTSTGHVYQMGGEHEVSEDLMIGGYSYYYGDGTYELHGGSVSAEREMVGYSGIGHFVHTAGRNVTNSVVVGWAPYTIAEGTYELSGTGYLETESLSLCLYGQSRGWFIQTGGTVVVKKSLWLSPNWNTTESWYTIRDGSLQSRYFMVGYNGPATFAIEGDSAVVTVSEKFHLGHYSTFTAAPGATIHMTGAAFENESTDPDALAGLGNLELIFEGGSADTDPFEIAGEDRGAVWDGFVRNFILGGLTLGGADVGRVQLVDNFDNGNRGGPAGPAEALYLHDLTIGSRSIFDMNNLHVYYDGSFINRGGRIQNGQPIYIPEPATLALLAAGLAGLIVRKAQDLRLRRGKPLTD